MTPLSLIRLVALLSSGIMAGLLFGDWLGPAFARSRMSVSGFIEFQQIVHLNYLRVLPALSTIAAGLPILWVVVLRRQRSGAEFRLVLGAVIAILAGFMITLVFNVPVNDQLEGWSAAAPPGNAREIWKDWEQAHIVRTVFWMIGFTLEAAAVAWEKPKAR